jgi:hypothetical protein
MVRVIPAAANEKNSLNSREFSPEPFREIERAAQGARSLL